MSERRPAAFFDMDLTMIDVNSGILWARHEHQLGNISSLQMGRAIFWHAMYRLSLINMEAAVTRAMALYRGVDSDHLDTRTRDWFARSIEHRTRPGATRAVDEHRDQGHQLVLLTNSSFYQARIAAERWGFDDFLANYFPADEAGRLTGTFERPLCYGPGKVERAEVWAEQHGVDLDRSYFYSDSYSDLPMLERVGEPRVVCPDPRLRRAARARGWDVLAW